MSAPKQPLPRVLPSTPLQHSIHAEAQLRRAARLAARDALRSDPHAASAAAESLLKPVTHRDGSRATLAPALEVRYRPLEP